MIRPISPKIGAEVGDIVELSGKRKTVAKAMPTYKEHRGQARAQLDGVTRENAGVTLDQIVGGPESQPRAAERVVITPLDIVPTDRDLNYIGSLFDGLAGAHRRPHSREALRQRSADFKVAGTVPAGPVVIRPTTMLEVGRAQGQGTRQKEASPDPLLREHRRTETRAPSDPRDHRAAAALSRRSSSDWESTRPRGCCCTVRQGAARR